MSLDIAPALRAQARLWQRVPYLDGGRDLNGWDCWGLVPFVGRAAFGESHEQFAGAVASTRDRAAVAAALAARLPLYRRCAARPGAVALIEMAGRPGHVGIMLSARHMLHATSRNGTLLTDLESAGAANLKRRCAGFFERADGRGA